MAAVTFQDQLTATGLPPLRRGGLRVLQLNLGRLCNMRCSHCHVDAGPDRGDTQMSDEVVDACIMAMDRLRPEVLDLTGGAPEMHLRFRDLVEEAHRRGLRIIDRCNLTILLVPAYAGLPEWLAAHQVEIVASLPHWQKPRTDSQRGEGTWEMSIAALRHLNGAGYGLGDPRRQLTLMTNPDGDRLQPLCSVVVEQWKQGLLEQEGVHFDRLIGLTNMPIARFKRWLDQEGRYSSYMETLVRGFNPGAICGLMCRDTLSVAADGSIYDCDFNQMLGMAMEGLSIASVEPEDLERRLIQTADHCYGCTAGQGSSCSGSTSS